MRLQLCATLAAFSFLLPPPSRAAAPGQLPYWYPGGERRPSGRIVRGTKARLQATLRELKRRQAAPAAPQEAEEATGLKRRLLKRRLRAAAAAVPQAKEKEEEEALEHSAAGRRPIPKDPPATRFAPAVAAAAARGVSTTASAAAPAAAAALAAAAPLAAEAAASSASAANGAESGCDGSAAPPARRIAEQVPAAPTIPNVIYFTGPWNPKAVVEQSRKAVPEGTEFRYYSYADLERSVTEISAELEKEGVPNASAAFHEIRPRAFRADLWRYMVLWQNGGIYVDAKLALRAPLSAWVHQGDSLSLCRDLVPDGFPYYWNGMMAARRRDPTLLALIRRIAENTMAHYYPPRYMYADGVLEITGPGMLSQVIRHRHVQPQVRCRVADAPTPPRRRGTPALSAMNLKRPTRVVGDGGRVLAEPSAKVHFEMRRCEHCDDYNQLFSKHQVYCSEEGPTCSFAALLAEKNASASRPGARYWSLVV